MNIGKFREFLELIGHKVIASESGYWCEMIGLFYERIPFYETINPGEGELENLFRKHYLVGVTYRTLRDNKGKRSFVHLCDDKPYNLESLHPKMRNKVRQGLRNCVVRQIDFDYLHEHGMPLNRDSLRRQGRDEPVFTRGARWRQFCNAGKQVEGTAAWGAFVDNHLAAYMVTFVTDEYCSILYQMSRTELLPYKTNNALTYAVTKEMLSSPRISHVSYGRESIRDLPGLTEYKTRLGYKKRPVNCVVVLHSLLRPLLLARFSDKLLGALSRLGVNNDVLKRVRAIADIVKQS